MRKSIIFTGCLLFAMMLITQCDRKKDKTPVEREYVEAPAFDADSAFAFVKAQTDFGPRVPNSEAHEQCARYLLSALSAYCDNVMAQTFTATAYNGTKLHGTNIIGSFSPEKPRRVALSSHWDSRHVADHDPDPANRNRPIDGANDGASGVGVLLEVARQLAQKRPDIGVDIVLFDAEDYGAPEGTHAPEGEWWGLGSQYWAENPHVADYRADYGILLDMVGDANAKFRYEHFSSEYAQDILTKVWSAASKLGFGKTFVAERTHPITDDHYYVNTLGNVRMIDIIHQDDYSGTGFTSTWHTLNDNIDHIDKNTLSVVGKTLLYVIYEEK